MLARFSVVRNTLALAVSAAVSSLVIAGCSVEPAAPPPSEVLAARVASFKPVPPVEWKLPNGLTVMYLEDPELPVAEGNLFIRGGGLWEPAELPGVLSVMGQQMRQGGAGDLGPDALDRELALLSAGISSGFGSEFGTASFHCLSGDVERVFKLFADVILRPRFDRERLLLWQGQALDAIRRRTDSPATVAQISFSQLLYGKSPYAKVTTEPDVKRLSRLDLLRMHRKFVRPQGALLTVTGAVSRETVAALVQKEFGDWTRSGDADFVPPPITEEPAPALYFIELPFTQSTVYIGQLGVPRLTPDYPAIEGFNELFGSGGFESMLVNRVRTDLGLAYSVSGSVASGLVRGTNYISLQTKSDSTGDAIKESINVLKSVQRGEFTETEFDKVKRSIGNSFVFKFESPQATVYRRAGIRLLGYPEDYDDTFLGRIAAITPADVKRVAAERWDLSKLVFVVVGDSNAKKSVESLLRSDEAPFKGLTMVTAKFDQVLLR